MHEYCGLPAGKSQATQALGIPPENPLPVHALPEMLSGDPGAFDDSLTKVSGLLLVVPNEFVHPLHKIRRASVCSQSSLHLDIRRCRVIIFMVELQPDGIEALVYQNNPTPWNGSGSRVSTTQPPVL